MEQVVNITDKIEIRNLKYKIDRLKGELEVYNKTISSLRDENNALFSKNMLLQEENQELKKYLKDLNIDVTYGR